MNKNHPFCRSLLKKISEQLEEPKQDSYQNILRQKLIPPKVT